VILNEDLAETSPIKAVVNDESWLEDTFVSKI